MTRTRLVLAALVASLACPAAAHATGAWSTWLRFVTCNALIAGRDTVWMASGEAGLVRYVRSLDRFESNVREPNALAGNSLTSLAIDRGGQLWAGTPGAGVSLLSSDGTTWQLVNAFDGLPSDSVTALTAQGDTMWIGTQQGLALWDGTQIAGSIPDLGTPSPFRSNAISGIEVLHDSLFVATGNGVYVALISQRLGTWAVLDSGLTNKAIVSLASDGHQVLCLAGTNTYAWDTAQLVWHAVGGQGTVVKLRSLSGTVLCGSQSGLWRWHDQTWSLVPGSPVSDARFADGGVEFGVDPDGFLFATRQGALQEDTAAGWVVRPVPGPVDNNTQNVVVDGAHVWLGGFDTGVGRFDGTTWHNWYVGTVLPVSQDTSFIDPHEAFTLQPDGFGHIYIATWYSAVERIDETVDPLVFRHVAYHGSDPTDAHFKGWSSTHDKDGYVLIGGDTDIRGTGGLEPMGIDVYSPTGARVTNWNANTAGLSDNQIRALAISGTEASDSALWVGFPGTGVMKGFLAGHGGYATPPTFAQVTLPPNNGDIFGIAVYGDSVWVLSTASLMRFRRNDDSLLTVSSIPGAPAPEGAVHPIDISADGTVWVASVGGVRRYIPGGGTVDYTTDNSPLANQEVRSVSVDPVTGVVWIATTSGVNRFDPNYTPPPVLRLNALKVSVYPNPLSLTALGASLKLTGNAASYTGEILSIEGRVVARVSADGNGRVIWDGRDQGGHLVRPGIYFLHAHGGGRDAAVRIAVLR